MLRFKKTNPLLLPFILLAVSSPAFAADDLFNASLEDILTKETELKADIGARDGARNFLDSRTPVDVVTSEQMEHSGLTSLTDVMKYFVAGFNAPEPSIVDGSDHMRPFTLRGMGSDQVLVLVNGKRLHTSALLHVTGEIGHGSSNVDLDSIPVSSIEKVEILRDGAAAQYGSDAIAGVINIILKGVGQKNNINAHTGIRKQGDGQQVAVESFFTAPLKYDGFINTTISAKTQKQTQRAGVDTTLTPTHYGLPDSQNFLAALNAELPQENDLTLYSNALFNYRDSKASAFLRTASATRPLYPNGFLPIINAKIIETSWVAGVKGQTDSMQWDLSNTLGYSNFDFFVKDSMNYVLGAASPTSFTNGGLSYTQNTTNLDFKKNSEKLDLAWGGEYRYEGYQVKAGELASYTGTGLSCPGCTTGSQGFAGFKPQDAISNGRQSYALYLDNTYKFTNAFSLEGAGRFENFSDFGSTTNFKVASSYKVIPELMFRASGSTGFRAPSLSQQSYSQTSSTLASGTNTLVSGGTFRPNDPIAVAFGATPLKAEKSEHLTVGSVWQPTKETSLMIDYFHIYVNGRITLSPDFSSTGATPAQQAVLAANGISTVNFFTNAVNTETQGFDIKVNSIFPLEHGAKLDLGLWYSTSRVVSFNNSFMSRTAALDTIDTIEHGQPNSSIRLLSNYERNKLNVTTNVSYFDSYNQVVGATSYAFDPRWTVDLDIAYNVTKDAKIAIGGINIFDAVPSVWNGLNQLPYRGATGIVNTSQYSPIGISGAYYYVRASQDF